MGRQRSPNRDKAFELFKERNGQITSREIADILGEKLSNINTWRVKDRWNKNLRKVGAPYGNTNSIGNKGGAPKRNFNSFKYGKYTKRIPFAVKTIMEELDIEDPIEKLWRSICLHEAQIIYMQDIMHVEGKNDITKELKKTKVQADLKGSKDKKALVETYREEEYEIQFPWDKEAKKMNTLSRAMTTLSKLIKDYMEMLHANWDTATEEQKLRVERLRTQIHNPELQHRKEISEKKLELEKEKFEHTKEMDKTKMW